MRKYEDVRKLMENEKKCILRARELNCNQNHCAGCTLVQDDRVLLNAYETVIEILTRLIENEDDLK